MTAAYVRFTTEAVPSSRYGRLERNAITVLDGPPWAGGKEVTESIELAFTRLVAPVQPSKILCVGLNYQAHVQASFSADEAPSEPLLFLKPPSSVIGPGDSIVYPPQSERVDYEAELGLVIGKRLKNATEKEAAEGIFGLTCVNDVTARDLQKKDKQWSRAKGFDTFCPVGPQVVTGVDFGDLLVEGLVNGEVKQSGRTSQMIFPIPHLLSYMSQAMTLNPGDLILTGTPSNINPMQPGDKVVVRIESVGELRNTLIAV